jgi:signal transduction histidine kinase/CheY-like chemotaxis protein
MLPAVDASETTDMAFRFSKLLGIGVQNMVLAITLVALTGWSLPKFIEPIAGSARWDGQVANLKMETSQQAWAVYDRVSGLRRDVFYLAGKLDRRQDYRELLDGNSGQPGLRGKSLRIEVWPVRRQDRHFVLDSARSMQDLGGLARPRPAGAGLDDAQKGLLDVEKPAVGLELSQIRRIPYQFLEKVPEETRLGRNESQYVIWVAKYFGAGPEAEGRDAKWILMVAMSMDNVFLQLGGSPRDLAAVFQGKDLLLSPIGALKDQEDSATYSTAADALFETGRYGPDGQIPPDFFASGNPGARVRAGKTIPDASLLRDSGVLFYSCESRDIDGLGEADRKEAAAALGRLNARWVSQQWAGEDPYLRRVGGFDEGLPRIRLLTSDERRLFGLQREVEEELAAVLPGHDELSTRVAWGAASPGSRCALSYVWVDLDLEGDRHSLVLARALFRWELGWVEYWPWIWGAGTALIALAASLVITRPLQRMAKAAWDIAGARAGPKGSPNRWDNAVAGLNKALPTSRWDEIGVLARAFQAMLAEIGESHRQLLQLNRELEARVDARTRELTAANRALQETNVKLTEAHAAQKRFVFSISHDLKTPLTTVKGYCELLMQSPLTPEQSEDLGTIYVARERLQRLIEDVLDSQKIDLRELELDWKEFDVADLIREVGRSMTPSAEKNGNALQVECLDGIPAMYADPDKISRILTNLLSNACKFTKQGAIALRAVCENRDGRDWLVLTVADTGRGIDAAQQIKIFTPFPKIMSKAENPEGTGLGLSNCKGYCEAMGGTIGFISEPGRGTTFTVSLPLRPGEDGQRVPPGRRDLKAAREEVQVPPGRRDLPSNCILVIDDEVEIRNLMQRFLEKLGFAVEMAATGDEGVARARQCRPVLITLDALMPGRDGWAVLKDLKSDPQTCDIPVIMVSVLDDKYKGFALGASDYITKPIDWERLTRTLHRFRSEVATAPVLVVDDDPEIRAMAGRQLAARGWAVLEAPNGQAALQSLSETPPRAILLDLLMPVMDGFEFLRELRGHEQWSQIPVVVITAKELTAAEREQLTGRVVQIIQKESLHWDALEMEINRLVAQHARDAGSLQEAKR